MFWTLQRLFDVLGRCPKCRKILVRGFSDKPALIKTGNSRKTKKVTLPVIKDRKLAAGIADVMHKNSENKGGILMENYPGDLSLSEAFIQAGFSKVIATTPELDNTGSKEVEVLKAKNIFSRNIIWSEEEDSMSERLPHRLWPDAPVVTVFAMVSPEEKRADRYLSNYLIRKLCHLSGFYAKGRVEWFLFVSPTLARRLLCGSGDGPKTHYRAKPAVVNALYDIEHCLTVAASDFVPKFNTGSFSGKVPVYIQDELLQNDMVYLFKLVPRRDLHIAIPTQDIWPFYLFVKQLLHKRSARIIPAMESFIHGCGLKMIDMGFTMIQEAWQIKPAQYLDLYMNAISWPEFQDSFMYSYLKGKLKEIDNSVEDLEKDASEHIISDITSPDKEFDITQEHDQVDTYVADDNVDVGILEQIDTDITSEDLHLNSEDNNLANEVIK